MGKIGVLFGYEWIFIAQILAGFVMPGGRPTRYNKIFHPALVGALARLGKTDKEMAEELGIALKTLYNWKNTHPEFLHALKAAKEEPDDRVERSLFERALGYEHPEEKIAMDAKSGAIVRAMTTKHYPPDTAAAIIWLKNRRPEKWRDKQIVEHEVGDKAKIVFMLPDNGRGPDNGSGDS